MIDCSKGFTGTSNVNCKKEKSWLCPFPYVDGLLSRTNRGSMPRAVHNDLATPANAFQLIPSRTQTMQYNGPAAARIIGLARANETINARELVTIGHTQIHSIVHRLLQCSLSAAFLQLGAAATAHRSC